MRNACRPPGAIESYIFTIKLVNLIFKPNCSLFALNYKCVAQSFFMTEVNRQLSVS